MNTVTKRMQKICIPLLALALAAGSSASAREFDGNKVYNMTFPVAGGEVIKLAITDAGPLPVENRKLKIEVAGFSVEPSPDDPQTVVLVWHFGFTAKRLKDLQSVEIAEVSPSATVRKLLRDDAPQLVDEYWKGALAGVPVGPDTTPWLYTDEPSMYVFRFTVHEKDRKPIVLHQAAWFSGNSKQIFREMAARARKS